MATENLSLSSVLADARTNLYERWADYREDFGANLRYACDVVAEVADSAVPIYYSDLLTLANDDASLAIDTPEVTCDIFPPALAVIAGNVYERVSADLIEYVEELRRLDDAAREGYERGVAAGSWVIDGNTSDQAARRLLAGIEDEDPQVLDALPSAPLSGQWADGLTPCGVLAWYDLDEDCSSADGVVNAFEDGFSRGVLDEVMRSARAHLGDS
jgi:hypothetical protein